MKRHVVRDVLAALSITGFYLLFVAGQSVVCRAPTWIRGLNVCDEARLSWGWFHWLSAVVGTVIIFVCARASERGRTDREGKQ